MKIAAMYFLGSKFLDQSEFVSEYQPHSLAYFCPTCGEVWGRILCNGQYAPHWSVEVVPCVRHTTQCVPSWGKVPGSFCSSHAEGNTKARLSVMWWGRALEHLPSAVFCREFEIALQHFERNQNDC
jgi:hypothetical protein